MVNEELRQRAEEIGDGALDFDTVAERHSFIQRACGDDETLTALVIEYVRGGDALVLEPVIREREPISFENRQIGPWRLLRPLGEGGFGVVYLAERDDGQVRQLGAIKFLKGTVHNRDLELRFLDERQILANLNHPGIVRLIDAGVSREAQAYLVMEYVEEALPIDAYCVENKLSIKERLLLFRKVCEAVAYAHRKLVVHRDLKPSNILVTRDGTPRLLDFGVAKILDPTHRASAQSASSTNVLVGTARYFSPEQARREPVDTTTDIYSLGVVLYELLVGTDPYDLDRHGNESIEQIICNVDPEPPSRALARTTIHHPARGEAIDRNGNAGADSTPLLDRRAIERLGRLLRGDLDRIVLMALRKEPQRRYASVDQFSEDIRRHLEGLPVTARRDTYGYRASKFVQRNKVGVAGAALIVLSLIAGFTATIWQARRAQAAQAMAERRFNDVRRLAHSYLFEFHDEIAKVPGTIAARTLMVRRALEYLDSLAKEASGERELQQELATAYEKVGDAQGRPGFANIGDRTGALESYRHALAIRQSLADRGTADLKLRREMGTNYERIGDVLLITGQSANALASYQKSLELREAMLPANDRESKRDFATICQRIAQALWLSGRLPEAKEPESRALATFEELAANLPNDPIAQRDLFIAYVKEGDLRGAGGDKPGALTYYRKALPIAQGVEPVAENKAKAKRETASVHDKIGNLLAATKETTAALENYRAALNIRAALVAADPNNAEIGRDLSISHEKIGTILAGNGNRQGALAEFRQSLSIDTRLLEADRENAQARLDCAASNDNIGELLLEAGDLSGALASQNAARELREWVIAKDRSNLGATGDLVRNYKQIGAINDMLAKRDGGAARVTAACGAYRRSLELLRELDRRDACDPEEMKSATAAVARCEAVNDTGKK